MLNLNINCDILQEKNIVRFNGAALELMRYEGQEIQGYDGDVANLFAFLNQLQIFA